MLVKIGLLTPYSSIYPNMSADLVNGFEAALPETLKGERVFQFIPEYVGQGGIAATTEAARKLLAFHQVDFLSGLVSYKAVPDLVPLVEQRKKLAFLFDVGEYIPYTGHLSNSFFFNSLQLWQAEYALGYWAHKEFGDQGSCVMSLFDAGYHLQSSFRQGAIMAGSQVMQSTVLHGNPRESMVKLHGANYFQQIHTHFPTYLHPIFCGTEAVEFYEEYARSSLNGKVPLVVSSHMASDEILEQVAHLGLTIYAASLYNYNSTDKANLRFKQLYAQQTGQKPSFFSLLGYEMGLAMQHLVPHLQRRDMATVAKLLREETVKSPRGERSFFLDSSYSVPVIDIEKIETGDNVVRKFIISQGRALPHNNVIFETIHRESVSGWQNPYLCV